MLAMTSHTQFRVSSPPDLNSTTYQTAVADVQAKGALSNSSRTSAENDMVTFWATADPLGFWFDVLASVGQSMSAQQLTTAYAMLAVSQYDSIIANTESKKYYMRWRPFGAISNWTPAANADNSPDYPAVLATVAMTSAKIVINAIKADNGVNFTVSGRAFTRVSDAAREAARSRVLQGVHFPYSNDAGISQGSVLADLVYSSKFSQGTPTPAYAATPGAPVRYGSDPIGPAGSLSALGAVDIVILVIVVLAIAIILLLRMTPLKQKCCPPTTVE